jgi:F-type H+-transporting ATPase subunit gamma
MASVIANLAGSVSGPSAPRLLAGTGSDQKHLIVVATADRGLAGGFNSGIARAARDRVAALVAEGKDVEIITLGRKGRDALRRSFGSRIVASFDFSGHKQLSLAAVSEVAELILSKFAAGEADVVTLFIPATAR